MLPNLCNTGIQLFQSPGGTCIKETKMLIKCLGGYIYQQNKNTNQWYGLFVDLYGNWTEYSVWLNNVSWNLLGRQGIHAGLRIIVAELWKGHIKVKPSQKSHRCSIKRRKRKIKCLIESSHAEFGEQKNSPYPTQWLQPCSVKNTSRFSKELQSTHI